MKCKQPRPGFVFVLLCPLRSTILACCVRAEKVLLNMWPTRLFIWLIWSASPFWWCDNRGEKLNNNLKIFPTGGIFSIVTLWYIHRMHTVWSSVMHYTYHQFCVLMWRYPLCPPEYVIFFEPFHFLAGDQLVVPMGASHISLRLQEIQSRVWEKKNKRTKRTIRAWG